MELSADIFGLFDKKWALLTAGNIGDFNMMTISWGSLGTLWGHPAATVYVRESRLTHRYMEKNEYFTISFYPEEKRKTLGILGSKSGRDIDKMHTPGLKPKEIGSSVTFDEAECTLLCKKLYKGHLEESGIPGNIVKSHYPEGDFHDFYVGEVIEVYKRSEGVDEK